MLLSEPEPKEDLKTVKEKVQNSIRRFSQRGYLDYKGCDSVCTIMEDCLTHAKDRLDNGCTLSAFEIGLYILLTSVKLASTADSSSGSLSMVIDGATGLLEEACRLLASEGSEKDKKYCYEKLCKEAQNRVFEGWSGWDYEVLNAAAAFVTIKNEDRLSEALVALRERNSAHSEYFKTREDLIRLKAVHILRGREAARVFVDEHVEDDTFREIAVREDMKNGNYENAERLCLDKIGQLPKNGYSRDNVWLEHLYAVYEKSRNRTGLIKTADTLLFRGELEYYDKLKALYAENGEWEAAYPLLRSRLKKGLPYPSYMHILDLENELDLLFEEVKQHPSAVFDYGPKLAEKYPNVIFEIYRGEIERAAQEANDRNQYKKVCGLIRELHNAGGKAEAAELIDRFYNNYARRPAMRDELEKLRKKLDGKH